VVCWNLHVQSSTTIAKVFGREDGALLANQEGSLDSRVSNVCIEDPIRVEGPTEKVLQPTLSGQIERSETFKFFTP
jgi:hypothetical protein